MEFSEAQQKQIRDTLNKQRRLCELYQEQIALGAVPQAAEMQALVASTANLVMVVTSRPAVHDAATIKAAVRLQGSARVMELFMPKPEEVKEVKTTKTAAKPAKKAKQAKKN